MEVGNGSMPADCFRLEFEPSMEDAVPFEDEYDVFVLHGLFE